MAHLQMLYSEWLDQDLVGRIQNKSPTIIFSLASLGFGGYKNVTPTLEAALLCSSRAGYRALRVHCGDLLLIMVTVPNINACPKRDSIHRLQVISTITEHLHANFFD